MKIVAKIGAVFLIVICAVFLGYAQEPTPNTVACARDENLPPLLRPSDYAVDRAKEMGGDVFKLLQYGGFVDYQKRLTYYYCPWQAFYSFKNRSHESYQISFVHGEFRTGGPWDYGFFADLGQRHLREIDRLSPEAEYFMSYKPPKYDADVRREIERLKDTKIGGLRLTRNVTPKSGHTYLLRSISFYDLGPPSELINGLDLVVALHVLEMSTDGAITIVWKKLGVFPAPLRLHLPDKEYQKMVDALIVELKLQRLRVKISDNCLVKIGTEVDKEFGQLVDVLNERKIPYRGFGNCKRISLDELLK